MEKLDVQMEKKSLNVISYYKNKNKFKMYYRPKYKNYKK